MPNKARATRATSRSRPKVAPSITRGGAPAQERELRSQGRKTMRRLLEAGNTVFERRGYHAARVDDIVKVAKTSHGTFYLYFANKEDLFKALAHDALLEMAALADELGPVSPDAAGREALRTWIARFVESYAAHGNVIRSWTEGAIIDSGLIEEGRDMLLRLSGVLGERIEEAGTNPGRSQAAGVACLAMLERFTYFVNGRQVAFSQEDIVDTLTDAAFAGFFAPRPVLKAPRARRTATA